MDARFWRWQVPQVSMTVSLASWFFAEISSMTLWQLVQATSRASWVLPFQKTRLGGRGPSTLRRS